MKTVSNEQGVVLIYVLITLFILLLIAPIAYQQVTQERYESLRLLQQVQANQLAETSFNRVLNDAELMEDLYGHTNYDGGRNTEIDLYVSAYKESGEHFLTFEDIARPYNLEVVAYVGDKNGNQIKDSGESFFYSKKLENNFPIDDEDNEDGSDGLVEIIDSNGKRYESFNGVITSDSTYDGEPLEGDVIIKSGVGKFEMDDSIMVKATGTITVEPGVDLTVVNNGKGNSTLEFYSVNGDIVLNQVDFTNEKPSSQNILSLVAENGSVHATDSHLVALRRIEILAKGTINLSNSHIELPETSKSESIAIESATEDIVCVDQVLYNISYNNSGIDESYKGEFRGSLRADGNAINNKWIYNSCP